MCLLCHGGSKLVPRRLGTESVVIHRKCWRQLSDETTPPELDWRERKTRWLRTALAMPCGTSLAYSSAGAAENAAMALGWFAPSLGELVPVHCARCDAWHIRRH